MSEIDCELLNVFIQTNRSYPTNRFIIINSKNKLKQICTLVNRDDKNCGTKLMFSNEVFTVCVVDSDQIISLISFKICKNKEIEIDEIKFITDYLYINFTYTFVRYRQKGYNKILRQLLEDIAKYLNLEYVVSVPFENANSKIVLEKMDYLSKNNIYYKKLNF